jgi:UDP-glucose 4-epimerase
MKVLVTGSAGFIGGYLVDELLTQGFEVVGVDNYSKYGVIAKSYDKDSHYTFVAGDVKDTDLLKKLIKDCDHLIAIAAKIGGISYFHEFAYDLLAENERITASTFDSAIDGFVHHKLKKITVVSSSMVYESATVFPTPESSLGEIPPPKSTYGFQKLATEYFAKGAWEQYKLPFTIVRPFNCVGIGEMRAATGKAIKSGNVSLAMSHVVPDLVQKILKGQDPLHILGSGQQVRHYTYGGDLAKGIILAMNSPKAKNNDFNISSTTPTTVLELAQMIWKKVHADKPFRYVSDKAYTYDVQMRIPDTAKAKKILGFTADTSLDTMLDEIIPWIKKQIAAGTI